MYDACFDSQENTENSLFILSKTEGEDGGKPNCIVASCQNDFISLSETDTVVRAANKLMSKLEGCSVVKRDFSKHFRLKIEGNVYDAFKRKKQQQHNNGVKKQKISVN